MTTPESLDAARLRSRLVDDGPYAGLDVVAVTGSTNSDLIEAAGRGAPDRTVLIAEEQQSGRGRMRRPWISPRSYGLHVSVLTRMPEVARSDVGWLPLIAGVALVETIVGTTGLQAALKWPNDLLIGGGDEWSKAAGVLVEGVASQDSLAAVIGIGINVHHGAEQLPPATGGLPATSLALQGASVGGEELDREELAVGLLGALADADDLWRAHAGDVVDSGLLDRYQRRCGTLGQQVRVDLGQRDPLSGTAEAIDTSGRLVVQGVDGAATPISAGDVVHLRRGVR